MTVYVYYVTERLEREERYTDGQEYVLELNMPATQHVHQIYEHVGVLEIGEHAEVDSQTQRH